ncbi:YadA-like family protein [Burkholderia cenocepacia]|uniref:YadA-like family protein n=1 Tax=Burkholderia cenocepacia TaxID=95486 RepID=UPI0031FBE04E
MTAQYGVALGDGSVANQQNTVSVGNAGLQRRLVNLASGTADTDAVNLGQMNTALSTKVDNNLIKVGTGADATVDGRGSNIAIGSGASSTGMAGHSGTVAIGESATASGAAGSIAFGTRARAAGQSAIAMGLRTNATGDNSTVIGQDSGVDENSAGSLALGYHTTVSGNITGTNTTTANNSLAIGSNASVASTAAGNADNSVAIGSSARVTADSAVALGFGSVADTANTISVGNSTAQRKIVNMAAGTQATDAVNVGQLTGVTNALGGGAGVGADGSITQPTYTVAGKGYNNVGDALDALAENGGDPDSVKYDDATHRAITLGDGATPVAIHNVAAGALTETSTDAVNGSQLFATNRSIGDLKDSLKEGGVIDPVTGKSLAVVYDGTAKDKVTLAGADGTTLSNVKAGVADMDAVNVGQMNTALSTKLDNKLVKVDGDVAASTVGEHSIAIGSGASADNRNNPSGIGIGSIAVGDQAQADGSNSVAVGARAYANSIGSAFGTAASASGAGASAIGYGTNASGRFASAIGSLASAAGENSVALGANSVADRDNTVSVGSGSQQRQIVNVAAGTQDTDAVNVSQLKDSGLIGDDGKSIAAVTYDRNADGTPNYGTVTLGNGSGPTQLKNVADATDDHDALNLGQLKNAGLVGEDEDGKLTSAAVTYDRNADGTINHDQITLAGADGTTITNVKAGALNETSTDAVNGSQLFATNTRVGNLEDSLSKGGVIDPVTGESLAVVYDGTTKDKVTLAGADGTTLSNVKAGVADMDAVNVSQLKDSGLIGDDGKSIAAVTYDRNADGTPNYGTVTLGNGAGPTQIKNVAAGVDGTDAVNVDQMNTGLSDLEERVKTADLRFVKVNADPVTGTPALATGALAVAIGSGAQAAGANALALGSGARVSGAGSVAIGYNSVANQNNVVSVGSVGNERRIVNVADGDVSFQSTDAVNGGQLYAAMNDLSTSVNSKTQQAIDSFSSAIDEKTKSAINEMNSRASLMDVTDPLVAIEGVRGDNLASLNGADPSTATAAAIGSSTVASGANAVAVGLQSGALSDNSVAIGSFAQTGAGQPYSVAMGSNVQTNGTQAVAMGANAQANADYALAVGSNNVQAIGESSIALGNGANVRAGATNSIAMGTGANIARNVQGAMALGAGATATTNGGIALGDNALANRGNALSIGRAGAERQIVNVAAGTQTTDAVNVGQLTGVTNALGGGAGVGADGSITQPTYTVAGKGYNNVGDALDALAENGGDPDSVKYDDATHRAITLGDGATPVAIHNVAAGALTETSTDAVNGSQLFATNRSIGDLKDSLKEGGVIDPVTGKSLAVVYDGTAKDKVTLAGADGTTLANVKAGVADMDAVNVSQLKGSGLIGDDGKSIAAVTYDRNADGTPNYGSVTLGHGEGPTQLKNVADATDDGDALNLGQLKNAGLVGEGEDGKLTSAAVTYDRNADGTINHDKVTLAGADGTTLANVKAGVADMDAVNVSQLKGSGLIGDDGKSIAAVTYDRNTDGTPNYGSVTLGHGEGPTQLKNVADATDDGDALNLGQLKNAGLVGEGEDGKLTSAAVTYDQNADGTINHDQITLKGADGTTLSNVKAGVADMDAVNVSQLKGSGLIGDDGKSIAAVTYDRNADGTPNYGSVTLGHGEGPTQLKNVADATDDGDALNLGQLKNAGLVGEGEDGKLTSAAVTYDRNADGTINRDKVTLAGADGTTLSNVKAGVADMDAVNVSQLKGSGLIGDDGKAIAAVTYDRNADGTPNYGSVTLGHGEGPTQLKNVADATDDGDALNLGQLKNAGLVGEGEDGKLTSAAVTYDRNADGTINHDQITLAGADGTTITNVKAGALNETSTDAVNGSQLFATNQSIGDLKDSLKEGGVIDPVTGKSLAVVYDGTAKDTVTLKGADGTTLANVKAGVADMDAVNVSQLKGSGLIGDDGKAIAAVTYDRLADGTPNYGSVTLGHGAGPTQLKNVAAATDNTDAVNFGQMKQYVADNPGTGDPLDPNPLAVAYDNEAKDKVTLAGGADGTTVTNVKAGEVSATSKDAINGAQLHGTAQSVADALGGGSTVGENGKVTNPTYSLADPTDGSKKIDYHSVGDALSNLDGRTSTNTENITVINKQLADSGLVDPVTGQSIAAVTYDRNADGTPNLGSVTLGGADATSPVALKNVADGVDRHDAINLGQLQDAGLVAPVDPANPGAGLKSLAVTYDNTNQDLVTLKGENGTTITNVKAGAADMDAVNVSQLKGSGLIGDDGKSLAAVTYDRNADGTPNYGKVTLGHGEGPTQLKNVADATDDGDALNLGQLKNAGLVGEDDKGNLTSAAVTYDQNADGTINHDQITLKGADGTTLSNVKAGVADMDAVNVSQLKGSGLIGDDGKAIAAVTYDRNADGTPNYGSVTLGHGEGPTQLKNVADATDDGDALNLGQLKSAGLVGEDGAGKLTSAAVTYDRNADGTINHDQITLAGADGTTITNVKAGALNETSTDAVNGSQLFATNQSIGDLKDSLKEGGVIDPVTGKSLAVVYDGTAKDTVTMAGADGTTLSNVKAGVADMDAVNVSQLKGSGLIGDDGKSIAAVTYDDATKSTVTLGGAGSTTPVTLKNVADGVDRHDAINLGQLQDAGIVAPVDPKDPEKGLKSLAVTYDDTNQDKVTLKGADGTKLTNVAAGDVSATSKDAINGSQLHGTAQSVADSLGGGSTGGADGKVTNPTYSLADPTDGSTKTEYHNVGDALANLDGRTSTNTENITVINKQLADTGLVDPSTGQSLAAVTYDRHADGTPNRGSVTLGGADATGPVALKNVADGVEANDAVNLGQLQSAGIVAPVDPADPGKGLKSLAVTYDGTAQDKVTLKGENGTTLTNVKAGAVTATSTDAINGSQLHGTAQSVADSLGSGSTVGADGTVTNPTYSLADPTDGSTKTEYHNVGDALANLDGRTSTNTENITVINKQLADTGLVDPSTGQTLAAVTYDRNKDGTPNRSSVTLGGADATTPVALKNVADGVDANDAVNLGQLQSASIVAPVDPKDPGKGLTSLAVTYDKHADGSANFDQISLKGENGTTITNVKAGAVSATSTDAINGSQLYGASKSVANALGGGSTVDANGNVTNPTYTVNNEKFDNVGDALENISSSLVHGSIGLVQQDEDTRDITVAKDTDGKTVNFAGTAGERVLTGVAAGAVSATSKDAINGSQLAGTAQSVADTIGGGTTVGADGKLTGTSILVNGDRYNTLEDAIKAAATSGATDSMAVKYDNLDHTSVTLGGTGALGPVRLSNVADGVNKNDAVNFGQLSELSDKIGGIDDRVGKLEQNPGEGTPPGGGGSGGSDYFAGTDVGTGTTPANAGSGVGNTAAGSGAVVGDGAQNATVVGSNANVSKSNGVAIGSGSKSSAEGATAIGSSANASGAKSTAIGEGASASGSNSVALGAGSVATGDNTVSVGSSTQQRTISNLADGVNASDAATKGQMDRAIGGVQGQVNELSRNAYSGIAAATALTMIPGVDPGKTLSFGIGGATFQGYQAVAFGGEARITQNLKMKAGVGLSSGGNTVGVGASYQW